MSSPTYHAVPVNDRGTLTERQEQQRQSPRRRRSFLAAAMLGVCIVSFVLQTELAQYVQRTTNYSKPYFILYIGHCCYLFMIPIQFVAELMARPSDKAWWSRCADTFKQCKQELDASLLALCQTSPLSPLTMLILCSVLLTVPAYLWYLSVNLTSMANLTAIYNTGCFFAYLFSILMLHDRIVAAKVAAVGLCILGVCVMAFTDTQDNTSSDSPDGPLGILVAMIGAAAYGFYEVFYKKYAAPPKPTILFANAVTGGIGFVTLIFLWVPIPLLHWSGFETFEWPDLRTLAYILAIASMSVVYNATFMCVVALVNPVFAAVGVMLTIPAVAVTDMLVTGDLVSLSTVLGSVLILIGFFVLNRQISRDEPLDADDTVSIDV
ncbi:hypothetical protein BCR43DRAFT_495881 [Syncephalastrum racemosum]|uniref:EamA domain-containing protein n=1 Tax=Syncephalastrum racemosum TaxID=13706 RepID=A0A1X2H6N7_SYNRA|nr:hypothetical protein BCR43DRAFT_495881 [Syncephalastrum racemosum]